jgi:hypothetical protein
MDAAGVLALVNQIRVQMAGFARTIVTDLADNKLSTMEGIQLGMQGMTLASSIAAILQGADADTRQKMLHVLEHGELSMPR